MQTARSKPLIELRPYQHAAMEAITRGFTDYQHQLAVKPTGCHAAGHPILMGDGSIKAVETIDADVKAVVEETLRLGGKLLITADHGNCEYMRNPDGSPNTAHTTNLVDIIYVADDAPDYRVKNGILADVAPTLLDMLGLPKPPQMTGTSLLEKK